MGVPAGRQALEPEQGVYVKRAVLVISIVLTAVILVDLLWREGHGHFFWYSIPGFFAAFGLAGCVAIVLIAKWLGHQWLQKGEGYYEDSGDDK
jgi:hypothetical protein